MGLKENFWVSIPPMIDYLNNELVLELVLELEIPPMLFNFACYLLQRNPTWFSGTPLYYFTDSAFKRSYTDHLSQPRQQTDVQNDIPLSTRLSSPVPNHDFEEIVDLVHHLMIIFQV